MRTTWNSLRCLGGATAVYLLMAACSGGAEPPVAFAGGATGEGGAASVGATSSSGGTCECVAAKPDVQVVSCDPQSGMLEQKYPNKTAVELARAVVLLHIHNVSAKDYDRVVASNVMVSEGKVAVPCLSGTNAVQYDFAQFILPQ